jgi:large subunit ribosomal protein L21
MLPHGVRRFSSAVSNVATNILSKLGPDFPKTRPVMPLDQAISKILSQKTVMYAKLLIHNTPFTVCRTDFITTHRMGDVSVGDVINLTEIREIGTTDYRLKGQQLLPKGLATVTATVMEHTHGEKVRAKMRRQRKGHRPLKTIKPRITILRVQDIVLTKPSSVPTPS